jgi:hypothetical protein
MTRILPPLVLCAAAGLAVAGGPPASPTEAAARLEARMAAGEGVLLPDADAELVRHAGTIDLAEGDWPEAFLSRAGGTICVAVSPLTGDYGFFDESGECFFTLVPVLPTTENWVAPFRRAEEGSFPDDDLYAPWRLVDVWSLSHAEFAESAEYVSHAESAENAASLVTRRSSLVTRGAASPATNLSFTAFSFTETNLLFVAAWPTNEALPDATLDLYGSTNLLDPRWLFLSSHPATNPPVPFSVDPATLPWYVEPTQHVHDATCVSITNVVLSPLDGTTVYTNALWSCETNRAPGACGFFRLGTHCDSDGDGLPDARETLVAGTDPASPDTDGDGVPDDLTAEEWLSHPLWAHNGDCTNLVIFLYEPITNGVAALRFDDLCIPLATNAGPWCLCIPTNAVVDCRLVAEPGVVVMLWYGPPEAAVPTRSLVPGWSVPASVAVPIWCDAPMAVFGGNDWGGGSCRFARPTLRVRTGEPGQDGGLGVCVHAPDGIARFTWSVEPAVCTGLVAVGTGAVETDESGPGFSIDVSDAVPGPAGTRGGVLSVHSWQQPFFGTPVLWGELSEAVSAHLCERWADGLAFCLSCGGFHRSIASSACLHAAWCATKSSLETNCDCARPFVRIGDEGAFVLAADDGACCPAHAGASDAATLLQAPDGLGASVANGVLGVAPEARSPTIGGFVARYRILDGDGGVYRDLSLPFTCADLGVDPCLSDAQVPSEWEEFAPEAYYLQDGTFYVARRADPYPVRLWNESPSDARLVFAFASPTNGPGLFDPSLVTRHSSLVTTNAAPFAALNDDRTVYLDASCSNALATLSLELSDPATNRTFISESLSVQVVDTTIGEHWRVRSATDRIAWDFSDAPEPVWICLRHPAQNGEYLGQMVGSPVVSKTPSFSLDLPPNDYLIEAYFPRIYDGHSYVICETNTLHVRQVPEFARDVVGVQCRTNRRVEVALTNDTFHSDIQWTLSPIVTNGPRLFATSNSVSGATSMTGCSNVWVSAGTVPGVYSVTASYPGFTNAAAYVIDPVVDINGDFFRNGAPADDPREADPVCFTNDFGFVIPCNNNDSDGDGVPDCNDEIMNGIHDFSDLGLLQIVATGISAVPVGHEVSYVFELEEREYISPLEAQGTPSLRIFDEIGRVLLVNSRSNELSNIVLTNVVSGGADIPVFAEGTLHGACSYATLKCYLDGVEIGSDTICMLTAPFLALSNLDSVDKVFATTSDSMFFSGLGILIDGAFQIDSSTTMYLQDYAEIGSGVRFSPTPTNHPVFADFWSSFYLDQIGPQTGYCDLDSHQGFDGGNVEATPPDLEHPFGCVLIGSTARPVVKDFFERQALQTVSGAVTIIPTDCFIVGHVDEALCCVPDQNGQPYYFVGDLDLAIDILEQSADEVLQGFDLPNVNTILGYYSTPSGIVERVEIQETLDSICAILVNRLNVPTNRIIRAPVLYKPKSQAHGTGHTSSSYLPNSLNMIVLTGCNSETRFAIPEPFFAPFEDFYADAIVNLGHDEESIGFVSTLDLHPQGGEAHCGSNVQRLRTWP